MPLRYCPECQDMMDSRLCVTGTYMMEEDGKLYRFCYIRFRPCGHTQTNLREIEDNRAEGEAPNK